MSTRRQDFLLGLVVLGFVALGVATIVFIYPSLGVSTRPVVVEFRHDKGVAPVQPSSQVMLSGALPVGKVTDVSKKIIDLGRERGGRQLMIVVTMEIDSELPLYEDCVIVTDQPPVGGAGVVVIRNVGTPGRKELQPGEVVVGQPAQSLVATIGGLSRALLGPDGLVKKIEWLLSPDANGSFVNKLLLTMDNVQAMTLALRGQLTPEDRRSLIGKVNRLLDNLATASKRIADEVEVGDKQTMMVKVHTALDYLGDGLEQATEILKENRPAVARTTKNIERLTARVNDELLEKLTAELDRGETRSLMSQLHANMDELNAALKNVTAATQTGKNVLRSSKPSIDQILANARATSATLKLTIDELYAAPWRLLYKPPDKERKQTAVFDAARAFAEAALYLDDTTARLQAIMDASDGASDAERQDEIRRIKQSLQKAFERFQQAEDYLWEQMK